MTASHPAGAAVNAPPPAGAKGPGTKAKVDRLHLRRSKTTTATTTRPGRCQGAEEGVPEDQDPRGRQRPRDVRHDACGRADDRPGREMIFSTSYGYKDFAVALARSTVTSSCCSRTTSSPRRCPLTPTPTSAPCTRRSTWPGSRPAKRPRRHARLRVAFPIPQTLLNINAFELGAQSVNPKVKTFTVSTGSGAIRPAGRGREEPAREGADVLTQHQDCTSTVIKATEAAHAFSVGYHSDAQRSLRRAG